MMDDFVKHRIQTWRILSTCAMQSRCGPRHGKDQTLYKEDEGKDEDMIVIIDVEDIFRSGIVM